MVEAAFYGDDFTGSTDALLQYERLGLRSALLVELPAADELRTLATQYDVIGVAGIARSLQPDEQEAEIRPILTALRELAPRVVQYKICSTADSSPELGSLGRALEVGRSLFGPAPIPVLVAQPELGRYTVFGHHFAAEAGIIHRLDRQPTMANHPATPMTESDLRLHLAAQTRLRIGSLDLTTYADLPDRYARATDDVVILDALTDADLLAAGTAILATGKHHPLFTMGSGGLSRALATTLTAPGPVPKPTDATAAMHADSADAPNRQVSTESRQELTPSGSRQKQAASRSAQEQTASASTHEQTATPSTHEQTASASTHGLAGSESGHEQATSVSTHEQAASRSRRQLAASGSGQEQAASGRAHEQPASGRAQEQAALGSLSARTAQQMQAISGSRSACTARQVLVVSGSRSGRTAEQIATAVAAGWRALPFDPAAGGATAVGGEAVRLLRAGVPGVVVHTSRATPSDRTAGDVLPTLAAALADVVRMVAHHTPVRRVLIAGGDTSGRVLRALGVTAVKLQSTSDHFGPGATLCRTIAPDPTLDDLEVLLKGGQIGAPDLFEASRTG